MFETVLSQYMSLAGFAAVVSLIINVLKWLKVVPDGSAPLISGIVNGVFIIVMYALRLIIPEFDFMGLDPIAIEIAAVGNFILQYVVQLAVARATHNTVAGLPVVGYSYSKERQDKA